MSRKSGRTVAGKESVRIGATGVSPEAAVPTRNSSQPRYGILVLGMHRSGTSAFARVLNLLGAQLPSNLLSPMEDNPKGFWESYDLEELHEEFLAEAGSSWHDWRSFDMHRLFSAAGDSYRRRLAELLRRDFSQASLCVIKDPRICRFVPLWLDALRDCHIEPLPLIPLRNPLEVVKSLARRNGFPHSASYLLWLRHVLESERSTRGMRRCFVSFDELLADWEKAALRVAQRLRIRWPVEPEAARAQIASFLDPSDRHQRADWQGLNSDPGAPGWVKIVYRELGEMASLGERPENHRALDRVFLEFDAASSAFSGSIYLVTSPERPQEEPRGRLARSGEEQCDGEKQLDDSWSAVETLSQQLAARDQETERLREELEMRGERIQQLLAEAKDREAAQAKTASHVHHVEAKLHEAVHRSQAVLHELHLEKQISYSYQILADKLYLDQLARQRRGAVWERQANLVAVLTHQGAERKDGSAGTRGAKRKPLRGAWSSWWKKLSAVPLRVIDRLLFRVDPSLAWDCLNDVSAEVLPLVQATEPGVGERTAGRQPVHPSSAGEMFSAATSKASYTEQRRKEREAFLVGTQDLHFSPHLEPQVSVVLVLYNRAELTYACLRSIIECARVPVELVVVDNDSKDGTPDLLRRVHNVRVITNPKNRGFVEACNQAVEVARGRYILFLNNDAELFPGTLEAALAVYEEETDVGAVGGKILLLDGRLQEAGSIIWQDGSCLGYGRGDFAFRPEYMFRREVDYCSGAFLLVPTTLFRQLGGFDQAFAPAYYEETDFCMRVRDAGYRVLYEPRAIIRHFEFASTDRPGHAIRLQERNREIFKRKHAIALAAQCAPALENVRRARFAQKQIKSVLYIDDRVPMTRLGGGFPRSNEIVRSLCEAGCRVTIYPLNFPLESTWDEIYEEMPVKAEVMIGEGRGHLGYFLEHRIGCYDIVFVSRPHNMEFLNDLFAGRPDLLGDARLIYDSEAIAAFREQSYAKLVDATADTSSYAVKVREELSLARNADWIFVVSPQERDVYLHHGYRNASVLGHALRINETSKGFDGRENLLFVGNLDTAGSPNVDSLQWFVEYVFPIVRRILGDEAPVLHVIGSNQAPELKKLAGADVIFHGAVSDLLEWYANCRVFVAPTRFAAGIPHKIHEAAANGLPVAATDILIDQLRWTEGVELVGAGRDDPEGFARKCAELYQSSDLWERVRHAALFRVRKECSVEQFKKRLREDCGLLPRDDLQHAV